MKPLFTIGYSSHPWDAFLALLRQHCIEAIADVRSSPYSARNPCYSREALSDSLKSNAIRYVFLGAEFGARRTERECYINGKADYTAIAATSAFRSGLNRLNNGLKHYRIALLCAEKEPMDCHRAILVARHASAFAEIQHIHASGVTETQTDLEKRLLTRFDLAPDEFFQSREEILNSAYKRRGQEIAWTEVQDTQNDNEF